MANSTKEQFTARYPDFSSITNEEFGEFVDDSLCYLNESKLGSQFQRAQLLFVAHSYKTKPSEETASVTLESILTKGRQIKKFKAGEVEAEFESGSNSNSGNLSGKTNFTSWLNTSLYGQNLIRLLRKNSSGIGYMTV